MARSGELIQLFATRRLVAVGPTPGDVVRSRRWRNVGCSRAAERNDEQCCNEEFPEHCSAP